MMLNRRALLAMALDGPRPRVSAVTDEVGHTEAEAFAFCRQYGLQAVELRNVPGTKTGYWTLGAGEQRALARRCGDEGVRVTFIDSGLLAAPLEGPRFEGRMAELDRVLELAHVVGAPAVRCFAFRRVAEPRALYPRIAELLGPMVERAAQARVRLLLENESSCNVNTCAEMAAIAELMPSEWFGLNWDPGNAAHAERAWPEGYALLPLRRVFNVQVKGKGILPGGPDPVDWGSILRALRRDGYGGWVGLETHTAQRQVDSHAAVRELLRLMVG